MVLFQRYALIYESSMTLAGHEEVAAEPGQDQPQMEAPLPVAPVKLLDSSIVAVMDEVAEIGSGWWSDPPPIVPQWPPIYVVDLLDMAEVVVDTSQEMVFSESPGPVPPVQVQLGDIEAVLDEVAEIGSGWWTDPPPPVPPVKGQVSTIVFAEEIAEIGSGWWTDPPPLVFPHLPVYVLDLVDLSEVVIDTSQEMVFSESPGPVPAVQIQLSDIEAVLDEIAEIGSGWWSDPPPPVPPIKGQVSSIEFAEEVEAIEGGWWSDPPPPVPAVKVPPGTIAFALEIAEIGSGWWSDPPPLVPPVKGQVSTTDFAEEVEAIEGGWWTDPPPIVLPVKVPPGTIAFALEIPDIGSGWWSDPPPIVLPIQMQLSTIEVVNEEVEALGGVGNNDLVIVHFPYVLIYQSLSGPGPVPDEVPEIGSGWWSDPPPPVPPVKIQLGSIEVVLQDIAEIGSGWWSDAPGPVAPIRVPDSSIAFAEEVAVVAPSGRIRRLRELGMGILKRQQLG